MISIHCPLTLETENMFGMEEFRKMKRSALLVNTARGGIVNESDLLTALQEELIARCGFGCGKEGANGSRCCLVCI